MTTSIDFGKPVASDNYLTLLASIRATLGASASLLDTSEYTVANAPSGLKRFNASTGKLQTWNGSAWSDVGLYATYDEDGNQIKTTYAQTSALSDLITTSDLESALAAYVKTVDVDSTLDTSSTHPIQNGVVATALNGKLSTSGGTISGALTVTGQIDATGGINGSVARATGDADGNAIASTYLKKSGGEMTGTLNGTSALFSGTIASSVTTSAVGVTITGTSPDATLVTGGASVSTGAGGSSAWAKIVGIASSTTTITLGSNWYWQDNDSQTPSNNSILFLVWCGSFGIASLAKSS